MKSIGAAIVDNAETAAGLGRSSKTERPRFSRRALVAGAAGNLIEFYDSAIYTLLAPVFSQQFFPTGNRAIALLYTYGIVVGVSFVVRPLASMLLSPYGDRHGRGRLLSRTLFIMGSGLLLIGLTPTYQTIGWVAPVLLIVGRGMQNVSQAGEFQAAAAFLVEHAPPKHRATTGSLQYVSSALGILSATLVASLVTSLFPKDVLNAWGWRVPFVVGAGLCLFGTYLRRRAPESPLFTKLATAGRIVRKPVRSAIRTHGSGLFFVAALQLSQVTFYVWQVFLPTYASLVAKFPLGTALPLSAVALAAFIVALPLVGMLSDRLTGRKPLIVLEAACFAVFAYPALSLLQQPTPGRYLLVAVVGNLLLALTYANVSALYCELFPTGVRASGVGVAYNLAITIFGGSTPIVATSTIAAHHNLALGYYIMVLEGIAALVFLFLLPETRGRDLDEVSVTAPGG
ncbi:MFS transporter [Amycolatopsis anabasis]|uniref:MFS transporter n=1 Tax=Amycolatopsis anabasis TaxID=1840409 RepID=UPI001C55114E|nr:MFS transporter [Amycolatopsis anabasis]